MNIHSLLVVVSLNAMCALASPTPIVRIYDKLLDLGKEDKFKCPSLRKSVLLTPEPDFLKSCIFPETVIDSDEYNPILATSTLCMLYYESFLRMCVLEPRMPEQQRDALFNSGLLNSPMSLSTTCQTMLTVRPDLESKLAQQMVRDEGLCLKLCADKDEGRAFKPCEWAAFLLNMAHDYEKNNTGTSKVKNVTQGVNITEKAPFTKTPMKTSAAAIVTSAMDQRVRGNTETSIMKERVNLVNAEASIVQNGGKAETTTIEDRVKLENEVRTDLDEGLTAVGKSREEVSSSEAPVVTSETPAPVKNVSAVPQTVEKVPVDAGQVIDLDNNKKPSNNVAYEDDEEDDAEYPLIDTGKPDKPPAEKSKPRELDQDDVAPPSSYTNENNDEDDSYFFSYFMMICIVFVLGYVGYHNKQKILAMVLEGRKGKRQQRRRPNSANYHKLDSNLEEAVTSSCNKNTPNVIY